jgi:hypothetical protein
VCCVVPGWCAEACCWRLLGLFWHLLGLFWHLISGWCAEACCWRHPGFEALHYGRCASRVLAYLWQGLYMCHMRRRIHVCHMRRRMHVCLACTRVSMTRSLHVQLLRVDTCQKRPSTEQKRPTNSASRSLAYLWQGLYMYVHTYYVLIKPPMPYIASSPLWLLRGFASCLNFASQERTYYLLHPRRCVRFVFLRPI